MAKSKQTLVREQVAEAKTSFVPSTGDEDYLKTPEEKKKVIQTAARVELVDLKAKIELDYADGMMLAQKATERMISCGKHLLAARERFKGDKEFGQWRKNELSISASHVTRLMAVAREFGDNTDAMLLPIGTLAELIPASNELKQATIEKAKAGEKVTRAEVTAAKKAEKTESSPPPEVEHKEVASAPVRADKKPSMGKTLEPWQRAQLILDKNIWQRLDMVEVRSGDDKQINAFIIFGIPPYSEGMPSRDTITYIYSAVADNTDNAEVLDKLQTAYDIIMDMYF